MSGLMAAGGGDVDGILGPLCALGSSITWAFASAVYAQTAGRIGALKTNLLRSLLVVPLFLISAALVHGAGSFAQVASWRLGWLGLSALCSYGVGDLLFYLAALRLGTPTALAIASIYPIWATVGGALTLGESVGPARAAGTLLCILGVVWLVLQQGGRHVGPEKAGGEAGGEPGAQAGGRPWRSGLVLALLTSVCWAGNTYSIRRGAIGLPFLVANAVRYLIAVGFLGTGYFLGRRRNGAKAAARPAGTLPRSFLITAVIEAYGGSSIFVYGLSHSELSVGAPLSSLAPLFAVPIGLLLGTERLSVRRLAAIVLTVAGVVLLVR